MVEFFERHKRIFLLSGIALCILAIVLTIRPTIAPTFAQRGISLVITPMQRASSATISWVQGHFSAISNNQQLLAENSRLQEEINDLLIENHRLRIAGEENADLTALLDINQRYADLETLGARVIGANPNDWYHRFFLDRGTSHGVYVNMPVLGSGGLLGVIRQAMDTRSQFVSVIDSDFSASVMSVRTGDIGMISGDIVLMQQGLMRMDRIEAVAQIMPGDQIQTSIHSSIFPPGILVGTVVSVHPNPDGHTRHAIISPVADLDNISVVSIVIEVLGDPIATRDIHQFILED